MITDIIPTPDSTDITTSDKPDDTDITRAQLESIATAELGDDTPALRLWQLLNTHEAGRTHASTLAVRAGYDKALITNAKTQNIVRDIFGRMAGRGIARARAYQIMTGFTADKVASTLAKCMDQEGDLKVAARAAETASKCLGMQAAGHPLNVTVNVQVNQAVSSLVKDAIDDED